MKILVVDDDRIIRMGLKALIKRLFSEHEVVSDFQNGLLAFEYLKENQVDIVITDIKMPVMMGNELIEKVMRTLDKPPLFIVLSGYDEFSYVRDTMKAGAFNYLLKPINDEDLTKVINEAESKVEENKNTSVILNKSIEVLKRDFFKQILFSNVNINSNIDKKLLDNIQINENYFYKMIIIQRDKKEDINLINKFIKSIIEKYDDLEHISFNYESNTYILFFFDNTIRLDSDKIYSDIITLSNNFIENNKNVYIMQETDKVWELREQVKNFKKIKSSLHGEIRAKQYFLKNSGNGSSNDDEKLERSNLVAVKLAKQYIMENYNKNITLKDVADNVFLSQNYLSELFKREVGEGFYEFLSMYRISVAKNLLVTTNLRIYEISESIGYNDPVTFGRAFKKLTGYTPNGYRNNRDNFK
ncbi:response regulator [uncultured Clostridium sp.]|uniref:response regulator transcription factor n=1 Tax=uncultured Clostridium sp. TaxID=59620 RepID=UPI0025CDEAA0|nr:response regulator [uncultured Clostridium sp.]MDU2491206.1 response regulator [Clostridium celatum]MDU4884157.1 response regulator [Clostridium celatum]MDU7077366.1 response regulator [Clostridium celatum]